MAKKYKTKLIKTRDSYTSKQISELFNVHLKTVQFWVKEGLPVISNKPILIMGYELKLFLDNKQQNRKCKLESDQFYCTKCRKAVRSTDNDVWLELTGKTIGKNNYQEIVIKGVCDECLSRVNRFSHFGRIEEIQTNFDVINLEVLNDE
jgi:hypothetical protein